MRSFSRDRAAQGVPLHYEHCICPALSMRENLNLIHYKAEYKGSPIVTFTIRKVSGHQIQKLSGPEPTRQASSLKPSLMGSENQNLCTT